VDPTPPYLLPVRTTASYAAPPFPEACAAGGRFYIPVVSPEGTEQEHTARLASAHKEYRYLTAHETYPGHHVLDWARLHQEHPVLRQVESALFYEGWACYAEQLVDECGYAPDPGQELIQVKRRLWRAVRGRLDLGLNTGTMSVEQGAEMLSALGYSRTEARKQARRYSLTPGYQLCYTLGRHLFMQLRERFVPQLPINLFHDTILSSGQIPFPCLERILVEAAGSPPG